MKKNNNKVWIAVIAVLVVVIAALIVVLVRRKPKDDVEKVTSEEAIQTETEATPETASDATEAATTEAQATQDCFVKVTNSNSWESANGYSGQLDSTITNKTSGALKNWEIRMTVPDKTTLDSSWNGTFKLDGTTLSVKCVDYNAEVPANGNLKDIGVIVTVPSQADLKAICDSAVLYVDGKEYKGSSASSTTEATEAKEETKPKEKTEPESGTPVDNHGKLTLKGTDIVDKNGDKYQLKGVSTHGIAWFPEYVNQDAFQSLRDDMGANLIRIAMYSGENNGYCTGGDQKQLKELVKTGVDAATNLGMYVIIDWHVLGDQNPQTSAINRQRTFKVLETLHKVYENRERKIPVRELNDTMLEIINNAPQQTASRGRYIKIKYITQLKSPTPQFIFFCNLPKDIKEPYSRFLENKIRENWNFHGVPIQLFFREK